MRRDNVSGIKKSPSVQEALSGTNDINGASLDCQGYDANSFALCVKALDDSVDMAMKLQESNDNSVWNDVDASQVIGGANSAPMLGTNADNSCVSLGYCGDKRYIRPVLVVSANTGTDVVSIVGIQSNAHAEPV